MSPARDTRFKQILFCTDFSESAAAAFEFAVDAAVRRPGCTLHLLHVIHEVEAQFWKSYIYEVDNIDEQAKRAIDAKIDQDYRPRVPSGIDFKVAMRVGNDAPAILDYAEQNAVDLIVLGRQGRSGVHRALFGNVAEKVARKANCVVMIVPLAYANKAG